MKLRLYRKKYLSLIILMIMVGIIIATPAQAGILDWMTEKVILPIVGFICWLIISIVGKITVLLSSLVVSVASYDDFIGSPAVSAGWHIVRDLCNMFFILIMLIVAFATVLRVQKYNAASLLKYVLIYAILINFSKTICGLIIDIAQTIMGGFVGAFSGLGGADFVHILGVDSILDIKYNGTYQAGTFWNVVINLALMVIYAIVAMVVVGTTLLVFAMRIVMLWIYIILSPLAYLTAILPATRGVSSSWWNSFTKYVVTGPALAFFIWLTFSTMSVSGTSGFNTAQGLSAGAAALSSTDTMLSFIISICMLVAGLQVAQSLGGVTGQIAGGGIRKLQKGASWAKHQAGRPFRWAGRKAKDAAGAAVKGAARGAGRTAVGLARGVDSTLFKGGAGRGLSKFKKDILRGELFKRGFHKATGGKFHDDYGRARREGRQNGGKYKDPATGKEYTVDKKDGIYKDKEGNEAKIHGHTLKDYGSDAAARWAAGWSSTKVGIENEKARAKKREERYTQYDDLYSGMSDNELRSALSVETNEDKKIAIAMQLAENGDFEAGNKEGIVAFDDAKKTVEEYGDERILKAFGKKVNKKQAFLNYNLKKKADGTYENPGEFEAFRKKVEKGEIRLDEQKSNAIDKNAFIAFSESMSASQFKNQLRNIYNKDERLGGGLKSILKNIPANEQDDKKYDKVRFLGAGMTGDIKEFYGKRDDQGQLQEDPDNKGVILMHEDKLAEFLKSANANDFSNLKVEDLKKSPRLNALVVDSMSAGKLKAIEKKGENVELARYLAKEMTKSSVSHIDSVKIVNTPELSYFVDSSYNPDIVNKNIKVNQALKETGSKDAGNHNIINTVREELERIDYVKEQQNEINQEVNSKIKQRLGLEKDWAKMKSEEINKLIKKENELAKDFNLDLREQLQEGKITKNEYNYFFKEELKEVPEVDDKNSSHYREDEKLSFKENKKGDQKFSFNDREGMKDAIGKIMNINKENEKKDIEDRQSSVQGKVLGPHNPNQNVT
ncbi:MAG: hypothetical protein V1865_01150 [bacterium]